MEMEKTFLETFKEVFEKLKEEGVVTPEEIGRGFDIPMMWLASSGIHRDAIISAMRNIYEREFPDDGYKLSRFKRYANLTYSEKEGIPSLEIGTGKSSIFITDEAMESTDRRKNVSSADFIMQINKSKKRMKAFELMNEFEIPKEMAIKMSDCIFDSKQMQSDLYSTPYFLNEMAENFGEYYKYLQGEKQTIDAINAAEQEKMNAPIETRGGIIEQIADTIETIRVPRNGETPDRVSDIYPFEQRDEIFRNLNPKRIIKYDGLDRNRQTIKDAFTFYLYKNPQESNGYLGISEPLDGDREARAFYVTEELIDDLQGDENLDEFWHFIGEHYISMSRTEFSKEVGTYTFRHTGDLEDYKQKMEGVIRGIDSKNPQKTNARRASYALFGIEKYKEMLGEVTRSRFNKAKEAVFGDREVNQTKEGDVRNG